MMARRVIAGRRKATGAAVEYTWLLKTTSNDAAFVMESAGATADWEAVYDADGTLITTASGENPTFDLSVNTDNAVVAIRTSDAIDASDTDCGAAWFDSNLTSFDASALTNVTNCTYAWGNNNLTSFDASGFQSLSSQLANQCFVGSWGLNALDATSVESILVNIDLSGLGPPVFGKEITIDTDGSPLTSAAQTAVTSLKAKGWAPRVDGVYL